MNAHVQIEATTHALRAILWGDDGSIQDIVESDDAEVMSMTLTERGWRGTGLRIFYKDTALDEGELSFTEELESIRG